MKEHTLWVDCECYSREHALRITKFVDDTETEYVISIQHHAATFWVRLKKAWAMLVTGKCHYDDDTLLGEEAAKKLADFVYDSAKTDT